MGATTDDDQGRAKIDASGMFPDEDASVDEQFRALMEGLRTTLPGVEVLLAFLLTLPLQSGFGDLATGQRTAYVVALVAAAGASVLLISPSVHQRLRSLRHDEVRRRHASHLIAAVRISVAGTVLAAIAVVAAVYLAASVVLPAAAATVIAVVIGLAAAWTWFWMPLITFHRDGGADAMGAGGQRGAD